MRVCAWRLVYAAVRTLSTIFCHLQKAKNSGETDQNIDDANEEGPVSKQHLEKIEVECADQTPVDRAERDQKVGDAAEGTFHRLLLYRAVQEANISCILRSGISHYVCSSPCGKMQHTIH